MRGRKASVRYYASKRAYYTVHKGVTHKLAEGEDDSPSGPVYLHALDQFRQLMCRSNATSAGDQNTVRTIVELYLEAVKTTKSRNTYERKRHMLGPFVKHAHGAGTVGSVPAGSLADTHIESFLAAMQCPRPESRNKRRMLRWHEETIRTFYADLKACFNWALKRKPPLLKTNPVADITVPAQRSRATLCLVDDALHKLAMTHSDPDFRQLLVVLKATGCRPGELFMAEAKHYEARRKALVYHSRQKAGRGEALHKTSGKGKERVIYLAGESIPLVQELVEKHPTGPLFRAFCHRDHPGTWTSGGVYNRMSVLRKRHGLPRSFILYSYRHTFATNWLVAGRPIETLAVLLGNSAKMIRHHYSHLCDHPDALRRELESFSSALP